MKPNMAMAGSGGALLFAGLLALAIPAWAALLAAGCALVVASLRAGPKRIGSIAELARDWGLNLSSSQTNQIPGSIHGSGKAVAIQEVDEGEEFSEPPRPPQSGPLREQGSTFDTMPEYLQEYIREASMNSRAIVSWELDNSAGKLTVGYGEDEFDSIPVR
jgi:hypothetical protein